MATPPKRKSRFASRATTALLDALLVPFVALAALLLRSVRHMGVHRLTLCRTALLRIGILPVRRHYYEPFTEEKDLRRPLTAERSLPGIDWNIEGQLAFLDTLRFEQELAHIATRRAEPYAFYLYNRSFEAGDAEFLYQLIRARRPRRVIEIGCGNSTLMAREALLRNQQESGDERYLHVCIEPYESPWLEQAGLTTIRKKLEEVDAAVFRQLEAGDLLFIDSSHVIRPQGDVLTEFLEILPTLRPGVIVHVHDIFSPRDYPADWVLQMMRLWNEQYLLEAFLCNNRAWKVIGALNLLKHRHYDQLKRVCPFLTPEREPGSFYIEKVG